MIRSNPFQVPYSTVRQSTDEPDGINASRDPHSVSEFQPRNFVVEEAEWVREKSNLLRRLADSEASNITLRMENDQLGTKISETERENTELKNTIALLTAELESSKPLGTTSRSIPPTCGKFPSSGVCIWRCVPYSAILQVPSY
jgi:hypothetical protein